MTKTLTTLTLLLSLLTVGTANTCAQADGTGQSGNSATAQALSQIPRSVPVVMLNMLKFREAAAYSEGEASPAGAQSMSGKEAYQVYREAASKLVAKVGGETVWKGDAKAEVIAPAGEEWDEVFLVRYPSVEAFIQMVTSEPYRKIVIHRSAALADSRLIATVEKAASVCSEKAACRNVGRTQQG